MIKTKNFGAANNEELKIETGNRKINGIKHPDIFNSQLSIFNSKKRYGFTLGEDTEIVSEDVNLSPLRGKYPPEAGERGLMKRGFTLAEVLITLVVIGVAAAITIPVLHSNTQGKEWNAAKQKARAGLGEAFKLASVNQDLPDISAKEYVKTVLPKYLKLAKTCDTAQECGFADYIKTPEGNAIPVSNLNSWDTITQSDKNKCRGGLLAKDTMPEQGGYKDAPYKEAGYFQTVDGFSVSLLYNPNCGASEIDNAAESSGAYANYEKYGITSDYSYNAACFSAVYDMNGAKGPNTVGKDAGFVGSFYSGIQARSAAVLPVPGSKYIHNRTGGYNNAVKYCNSLGTDSVLPTIDELSLMFLNNTFAGNGTESEYWSRTRLPGHKSFMRGLYYYTGSRTWLDRAQIYPFVRCVREDKLM